MDKFLKYSVLRYSPSEIAGEQINLGIIFNNTENNYSEFRHIKKYSRISSFDDEIDIAAVKALLHSIKADVEGNLFKYGSFDIDEYTKYYVNDFRFDKPKLIRFEKFDITAENLFKTYFRFEYEKSDRPSKAEDKKIIEQIIQSQGKNYKKGQYVLGPCNDSVKYDIVTDDYNIKFFDFDGKNLKYAINNAKAWAWNTMFFDKSTLIIYRYNEKEAFNDNEFKIILKIFEKANAKICDVDEAINILHSAS